MSPERATPGTNGWQYRPGFLSDTGQVRERNEDAFDLYVPEAGAESAGRAEAFFAVADGMGGHEAGDEASGHAIRALRSAFLETPVVVDTAEEWLDGLFHRIHDELRESGRDGGGRGMGSTLTVAVVDGGSLAVGHVGDSRLYRLRDGRLQQLTEDHSWVAEQIREGLLTEDEAERHTEKNVLTQCLGLGSQLDVFVLREEVRHGDRYVISSDGLHGEVDRATIERVLIEEGLPQDAARRLVGLAKAAGSPDNVTVVVFDTLRRNLAATASEPIAGQASAPKTGSRAARRLIGGGAFALLVGIALAGRAFVRPGDDPAAASSPAVADTAAAISPGPPRSTAPSTPIPIEADTLENPRPAAGTEPVPATPPSSAEASSSSEGEDTP